ncbi:MAG: PASTA domain-containing protein, partial [Oscillospiraceae bacterium]
MPQENNCIFCNGPITQEETCSWCGFKQVGEEALPGTLNYGTQVENYVIGDVLTIDGESTSYVAYDRKMQKRIILKEFQPVSMIAPRDETTVQVQSGKEVLFKNLMMDFVDLYTSLSKIESKTLQKVYNIFTANGTAYVALESLKGDSLKQTMIKRGKPYSFKEARWFFQDLFLLMETLARANLSHGGISDETIFVTSDNNAMLTGFAIQDLRAKNEHILYKLYEGFSAPEQYNTNEFQGFYTDIYSIAAAFYYAVTGRLFKQEDLELKELTRLMPKYAVDALRYATMPNPKERIDNIDDFILMLDNKGTVKKEQTVKVKEGFDFSFIKKKEVPYIIAMCCVVVLFFSAIFALNGSLNGANTSNTTQISENQPLTVPNLIGKSYSEIMNDEKLNADFYFVMEEAYSDKYVVGDVVSHEPKSGDRVKMGTTIYLTVSKGRQLVTVPPNLSGESIENVKVRLDDLGIKYRIVEVAQTEKYRTGTVVGTDKPEGTQMSANKDILVVYVANSAPIVTPTPVPTPTPTIAPTPIPTPTPT